MPKPFNFFQQISGLVFPDGTPTPFGLFFFNQSGFSGVYFPADAFQGAPIRLLDDDSGAPAIMSIQQSGYVDRELSDIFPYGIVSSGDSYPATPDSSSLSLVYNGNQTGDMIDNVGLSIPFNGNQKLVPSDFPNISIQQSGNVLICPQDNYIYSTVSSGVVSQPDFEPVTYSVGIYGDLVGKEKDTNSFNFSMYSVAYVVGLDKLLINTGESANITFTINTITFKRAS